MKFKNGIDPSDVSREIWWALGVIDKICEKFEVELVVTCLRDGVHGPASLHPKGLAADIRTRDLPDPAPFFYEIKAALDRHGYDTVLERTHIHVEFDPKPGESWVTYTS